MRASQLPSSDSLSIYCFPIARKKSISRYIFRSSSSCRKFAASWIDSRQTDRQTRWIGYCYQVPFCVCARLDVACVYCYHWYVVHVTDDVRMSVVCVYNMCVCFCSFLFIFCSVFFPVLSLSVCVCLRSLVRWLVLVVCNRWRVFFSLFRRERAGNDVLLAAYLATRTRPWPIMTSGHREFILAFFSNTEYVFQRCFFSKRDNTCSSTTRLSVQQYGLVV